MRNVMRNAMRNAVSPWNGLRWWSTYPGRSLFGHARCWWHSASSVRHPKFRPLEACAIRLELFGRGLDEHFQAWIQESRLVLLPVLAMVMLIPPQRRVYFPVYWVFRSHESQLTRSDSAPHWTLDSWLDSFGQRAFAINSYSFWMFLDSISGSFGCTFGANICKQTHRLCDMQHSKPCKSNDKNRFVTILTFYTIVCWAQSHFSNWLKLCRLSSLQVRFADTSLRLKSGPPKP